MINSFSFFNFQSSPSAATDDSDIVFSEKELEHYFRADIGAETSPSYEFLDTNFNFELNTSRHVIVCLLYKQQN